MKVLKVIAIIFGCLLGLLVLLGITIETGAKLGYLPSTETLQRSDIPDRYKEILVEANIIDEKDIVYGFYSFGLLSIMEDGNLYTDKAVISYETLEDELFVYSARFEEIDELIFEPSDDFWVNSEIYVITKAGDEFLLVLDNFDDKDVEFYQGLEKRWQASKSAEVQLLESQSSEK
ncbi:MAG: hypothetical protein HWE13_12885 [Gammaproteobacteria bacterium]|nr:hypothetical protein [Gammaproteobacteria bacterium]NVK89022.1 hypothetical protein [Gammaproteobacteria bacterium]